MFDIVVDYSKHSNQDILGHEYFSYQDNLILDHLSRNLQMNLLEEREDFIFDFKDMKCRCKSTKRQRQEASMKS